MFYRNTDSDIKDVFLYIRQSTDEKSGKQVRSMQDQRTDCEEMARYLGLNIIDVFLEDQSAKTPNNRPIFRQMLKELSFKSPDRRRADGILSWHPDRLSRNALEAGKILQMLDDELIKNLYFPAYSFHNDPSGKEHLFIEFARAKGYSDRLSVAVKRGSVGRENEGAYIHGRDKPGYVKRREIPENPKLCSLFPIPCTIEFPGIQRMFALRMTGTGIPEICKILISEGLVFKHSKISATMVHRCLSDPFYYGKWVVNSGLKTERTIDLRQIKLQDGTSFSPAISETDFWRCQQISYGSKPPTSRTKHINPIYAEVKCSRCTSTLRPARRKIKRAGGIVTSHLGYECHGRDKSNRKCIQSRVKAEILFDYIAMSMKHVSIEKKDYHRFMIGLDNFLTQKKKSLKLARAKVSRRLSALETEKRKLLQRKAILAEKGDLGSDDREYFSAEISRLNKEVGSVRVQASKLSPDIDQRIKPFRQFIELCQKLPDDWENADDVQKREISKKILLNLTVRNHEIQSVTWKEPFDAWLNGVEINSGGARLISIEPKLKRLWSAFSQFHSKLEN